MSELSDVKCRTAKPRKALYKLSDGGGLQLWVKPNGSRLWCFAYRFGGKQKMLSIGAYPVITLADARTARDDAKRVLANGDDPSTVKRQRKAAKAEAQATTFALMADELLAKKKREGVAAATAGKLEWLLGLAKAVLGPLPVASITAGEVLRVLQPLEAAGKLETAKRLRATIGSVFRYAVTTARADNDPTQALKGAIAAPKPKHRAAIIDPVAFGGLLRAIDSSWGSR
jgi:hypothetical protein